MTALLQRFQCNHEGRDYVVGDIHGYFGRLECLLEHIRFDVGRDRLFSLGDLIDRGPESSRVTEFLGLPWFHAIRGNHEQMMLRGAHTPEWVPPDLAATRLWTCNGGGWFFTLSAREQQTAYSQIARLPLAIEVALPGGGVAGLVHGDVIDDSWTAVRELLTAPSPQPVAEAELETLVWGRSRAFGALDAISDQPRVPPDALAVAGAEVVCFGHTPMPTPARLANTLWLDTGAAYGGRMSVAELALDGHVWSITADGQSVVEDAWNRTKEAE